jgi:hypothetical protein
MKKNNLKPEEVVPGSRRMAYFICKNNHSYKVVIATKVKLDTCKYCTGYAASDSNNLTHTDFFHQWDYKKNKLDPKTLTKSNNKKVWWVCEKDHSWYEAINVRSNNRGCPFCANRRVSKDNNLKALYPKIAKEWDYKKNNKNPEDVVFGSHYLAYWRCSKNHSYSARVYRRTSRLSGCPYCSGLLPSKENNLKVLFPKIAKEWDYEKNDEKPTEITSQSDKKRWWICSVGHSYYMSPNERTPAIKGKSLGRGCPYCTLTPRSRDEIYILFELKKFFKVSENDHKIKLSKINDVDIKLPNEKIVIEYDGAYWHKDKAERDKRKTKELQKAGWTVIRVREKPLKILSRKYNILSTSQDYKNNTNKVLKKISSLGYQVNGLNRYLSRKSLINKDAADKYMIKLIKERASVS